MTPPRHPSAGAADRTVVPAEEADPDVLARVIAAAFLRLPPSQWLVYDPVSRREVFPGCFRIQLERALAYGAVNTTPGCTAAALWFPIGEGAAAPGNGDAARLEAVTGVWAGRFRAFEAALDQHHPARIAHVYLAILAVRPDRQRRGTGTALLRHGHQLIDRAESPAYLEAANPRTHDLYLTHAYVPLPGAPFRLPPRRGGHVAQCGASPAPLSQSLPGRSYRNDSRTLRERM